MAQWREIEQERTVIRMCEYCLGGKDREGKTTPIFDIIGDVFNNSAEIVGRIVGDKLSIFMDLDGSPLYDEDIKFKYCPFCGRAMKARENNGRAETNTGEKLYLGKDGVKRTWGEVFEAIFDDEEGET